MVWFSAVIIARNEAQYIGRCVSALTALTDDVLVGDSGSTDGTPDLARQAGARVLDVPWQGFGPTKNALNQQARHDWVLSVDADEWPDATLGQTLAALPRPNTPAWVGVVQRKVLVGERWVRFGSWNPDRKPRLFHKSRCWSSHNVHERLLLTPTDPQQLLPGWLEHRTVRNLTDHVERLNRYSSLRAQEMLQEYLKQGKRPGMWPMLTKPWAEFVKGYVLRQGFRDGWLGYALARQNAYAKFLRYAKLRELYDQHRATNQS